MTWELQALSLRHEVRLGPALGWFSRNYNYEVETQAPLQKHSVGSQQRTPIMYASLFEQKVVPVKHSTKFRDESVMKSKRISKFLWVGALGSVVVVSGLAEKVYPGKVAPSSPAQTTNSASTTGTSGYNVTSSTLAPPPASATAPSGLSATSGSSSSGSAAAAAPTAGS
ncbi:MAG: hypothetical protein HKL82_04630 [Acidimicrobiaceae bacterium]|nr:hypothetical protein [Acidimicrobiaceae bacterium]